MTDTGQELLEKVWFDTIENLAEILMYESNPSARVEAGEVLVKYFIALGQSVNAPFMPNEDIRPDPLASNNDDDDEDDD